MQIERSRRASIVGSRIANGIQDAEDRSEQHTGAGIAERRIRFRRRPLWWPVMLMTPPFACAIMSKASAFS